MDSINISKTKISGVTEITANGWDGKVLAMSRDVFVKCSRDRSLDLVGVYVIYADHYDKKRYGRAIYVGQGDNVTARLEAHTKEKPFWNKVLIFTSPWMNIAYAFNIELDFINSARLANRYEIDNSASGQSKKLGEEDSKRCGEYIQFAKAVVQMANIDIFKYNEDGLYRCSDYTAQASIRILSVSPKRVLVLKGSKFDRSRLNSELVAKLELSSVLEEVGNWMLFTDDAELEIFEEFLPKLCGLLLSKFVSGCGVGLDRAFKMLNNEEVAGEL